MQIIKDDHVHNNEEFFNGLLNRAKAENSTDINYNTSDRTIVRSDRQLSDNFQTSEEKSRDQYITEILNMYDISYRNKVEFQRVYRKILFWGCSIIVILFMLSISYLLFSSIRMINTIDLSGALAIITTTLSFIIAILELIKIITRYCFLENDEDYITKIVDSILKDNLERFKESKKILGERTKDKEEAVDDPA